VSKKEKSARRTFCSPMTQHIRPLAFWSANRELYTPHNPPAPPIIPILCPTAPIKLAALARDKLVQLFLGAFAQPLWRLCNRQVQIEISKAAVTNSINMLFRAVCEALREELSHWRYEANRART
jgi:hypothetical protein